MKVNYIIFLLKNLIDLCLVEHCIAAENIFIIIVYSLLVMHCNIVLKLIPSKRLKRFDKIKLLNLKTL